MLSPPLPNPLPRGEREPEVPSAKGVIANSTVLPLSPAREKIAEAADAGLDKLQNAINSLSTNEVSPVAECPEVAEAEAAAGEAAAGEGAAGEGAGGEGGGGGGGEPGGGQGNGGGSGRYSGRYADTRMARKRTARMSQGTRTQTSPNRTQPRLDRIHDCNRMRKIPAVLTRQPNSTLRATQ